MLGEGLRRCICLRPLQSRWNAVLTLTSAKYVQVCMYTVRRLAPVSVVALQWTLLTLATRVARV